jgi:hypothetical protein
MEKKIQTTIKLTKLEVLDILADWLSERGDATFTPEMITLTCDDDNYTNSDFVLEAKTP